MGRPSSVKRLPKEVRELIGSLREGGRTIDEIMEKLAELEVDVSRSAIGRHVKNLDEVLEQVRDSRIIAEAVVKNFGDEGEDKTVSANIQMMHGLIMKMMAASAGGEGAFDAKDAMFMSRAIGDLSKAAKTATDREIAIRKRVEKEVQDRAEKAMKKVEKEKGLTPETANFLRKEIFGVPGA